jgi:hypothetical protein
MSTQFRYETVTGWILKPEKFPSVSGQDSDHAWTVQETDQCEMQRPWQTKEVMNEFVEMLKDNPKVWAVCATEDSEGIHVWTYIDSRNEPDLMFIFGAEWQLRTAHPEIALGFDTVSVAVGEEHFDESELDFLYRR